MQVIKVVVKKGNKLVSTFAEGEWETEYIEGVETTPVTGYLFAYSSEEIKRARAEIMSPIAQYWSANANVVGRIDDHDVDVLRSRWHDFWSGFVPEEKTGELNYVLCSSVTLVKRIE